MNSLPFAILTVDDHERKGKGGRRRETEGVVEGVVVAVGPVHTSIVRVSTK